MSKDNALYADNPFLSRRKRLLEHMQSCGGASVAIFPTPGEQLRNGDSHYAYRPDSNFYYLTGFKEPGSVLVLTADQEQLRSYLFCRERDPEKEIWEGYIHGPGLAAERFSFDAAFSLETLNQQLPKLTENRQTLWYTLGQYSTWDEYITLLIRQLRQQARAGNRPFDCIRDAHKILADMRIIKDEHEINCIRQAARVSAHAHQRAMRAVRPGMYEYELEAELLYEFRRYGAWAPAYTPIVASGANACVLHYSANDCQLAESDWVLIDAGAEVEGYAGDITRCFPANRCFTGPAADIYQLVLKAQLAGIEQARAGQTFQAPHDACVRVITQGLVDLKILPADDIDGLIEQEAYKPFFMHRTGHWLGCDVHDAGDYRESADPRQWRVLAPGMTLTIEPGCYLRANENVPVAFRGIGIRIEDDILITDTDPDILSADAPKQADEIQLWMSS